MNTRILMFPLAVAAVAVLDGCQGISPTDPMVKTCRQDDTVSIRVTLPNGKVEMRPLMIYHADLRFCRKAA